MFLRREQKSDILKMFIKMLALLSDKNKHFSGSHKIQISSVKKINTVKLDSSVVKHNVFCCPRQLM